MSGWRRVTGRTAMLLLALGVLAASWWLPGILFGAPPHPPAVADRADQAATRARLEEERARILELRARVAELERDRSQSQHVGSPADEMEPWARTVYSNLDLREKLVRIFRIPEGPALTIARMQLAKETNRRPDLAKRLLTLLEEEEDPEALGAAVRFAAGGRPIDNPTAEQANRLLALARSPRPDRRRAAFGMLIGPQRPEIEHASVLAALEKETDPENLALALDRIFHHRGGFGENREFWRERLAVLARDGARGDLRRWAKSLLLVQFLSLTDAITALRTETDDDRRQEWAHGLLMSSLGGVFLPAGRGVPPEGLEAALLEALRLTPSASTRRRLLERASTHGVAEPASFYREAALAERDPALRRDLRRLETEIRAGGEDRTGVAGIVRRHLMPRR
jgi:hypothetical protein